jgi:hypothetical protein
LSRLFLQNLPYPLFYKEGNSYLLEREARRDLVFGIHITSLITITSHGERTWSHE